MKNSYIFLGIAVVAIAYFGGFFGPQAISTGQPTPVAGANCPYGVATTSLQMYAQNPEVASFEQEMVQYFVTDNANSIIASGSLTYSGSVPTYGTATIGCNVPGGKIYLSSKDAGSATKFSGMNGVPFTNAGTVNQYRVIVGNNSNTLPMWIRDATGANDTTLYTAGGTTFFVNPISAVHTLGAGGALGGFITLQNNVTGGAYGAFNTGNEGVVVVVDLPAAAMNAQGWTMSSLTGGVTLTPVSCSDSRVSRAAVVAGSADACYLLPQIRTATGPVQLQFAANMNVGNPGATDDILVYIYDRTPFVDNLGGVNTVLLDTHNNAGTAQGTGQNKATIDLA